MVTEGWRSKTETMAARTVASGSSWRCISVPKALMLVQVSRNPQRCKGRPAECPHWSDTFKICYIEFIPYHPRET